MAARVGQVTQRQYERLVDKARTLMEAITASQLAIGEIALKIEPIHLPDGRDAGVYATLRAFADEIGAEFSTLLDWRWVASAWPEKHRQPGISYGVYKQLAGLPEKKRFKILKSRPPIDPRTGARRWTYDTAGRIVGHAPTHPVTHDERINKIHDLARDDKVAATAVADMLRRPDVAHRVIADPTSRHLIHRAEIDRSQQTEAAARRRTPAIRRIEHSVEMMELVGACTSFVSTMNRVLPTMHDHPLSKSEQAAVEQNLTRVRAAADWCATVIDTGDVTMDEQLEQLLKGDN